MFRRRSNSFNELKKKTIKCLEACCITVNEVVYTLSTLSADDIDEHKMYLERHLRNLSGCKDHWEVFGHLNLHCWNYLSYHLLDHLIKELSLEHKRLKELVKDEMETYKRDLKQFRMHTLLKVYCNAQKSPSEELKPPPEFSVMVTKFDWPNDVTLEVVENFRQKYAHHYRLRDCAMMLAFVRPGSFIISWFIPDYVIEKLKLELPEDIRANDLL